MLDVSYLVKSDKDVKMLGLDVLTAKIYKKQNILFEGRSILGYLEFLKIIKYDDNIISIGDFTLGYFRNSGIQFVEDNNIKGIDYLPENIDGHIQILCEETAINTREGLYYRNTRDAFWNIGKDIYKIQISKTLINLISDIDIENIINQHFNNDISKFIDCIRDLSLRYCIKVV